MSLEGFVAALRAIPEEEFTDGRVLETVNNNRVATAELDPYMVWKPDRYTRSLIYRDEPRIGKRHEFRITFRT